MASSNKTPNFGLSQWVGSDKPKREDFNADNLILDANAAKLSIPGAINWDSGNAVFLKSGNGYHKFPNGFTIQWGRTSVAAGGSTVTLPTTFTAFYIVVDSVRYGAVTNYTATLVADTLYSFSAYHNNPSAMYIDWAAFGYIA